jgi:hypothetical protein
MAPIFEHTVTAMTDSRLGSIVHATPGRIRLRIARAHRTPETFQQIEGLFGMLPGIETIEATPGTGSVLVRYDPATIDIQSLLKMGAEMGWVPPPSAGGRLGGASPVTVDKAKLAKGVVLLGVAGLGGLAGPAVGVGARLGSMLAGIAFVVAEKQIGRIRRRS